MKRPGGAWGRGGGAWENIPRLEQRGADEIEIKRGRA